ncbi:MULTISPECIES: hypothetical protein [Pseudomonas]|uniref:Uncharacterized protein n=1 Tax=Pseudomonas hamedanensis TaxID=2745504 RepID=A0A9E6TG15_9PSED|nr:MULTISPECIES: hypothetical protein [Pseudomonas]MBC3273241.1 hypothetical protein [Pseudomonas sp. SWRI81]QXI16552.1 hypothetical protein HU739_021975 [Pseudomonas hamedanensis]
MNTSLLLANAIALAILLGFHFVPETTEPLAKRVPHYLQVQKAPQWAVLSDQGNSTAQVVSESEHASTQTTERLVF